MMALGRERSGYQARVANVRDNKDVVPQKNGRGSSARVVVHVHLLEPGRGNDIAC
jgi:hypothetical protein